MHADPGKRAKGHGPTTQLSTILPLKLVVLGHFGVCAGTPQNFLFFVSGHQILDYLADGSQDTPTLSRSLFQGPVAEPQHGPLP